MAHRFPIAGIIQSWGVITLSKQRSSWANIIIIRLEWRGRRRVKGTQRRGLLFSPVICLNVPRRGSTAPRVSPTSPWHLPGEGAGHTGATIHQPPTRAVMRARLRRQTWTEGQALSGTYDTESVYNIRERNHKKCKGRDNSLYCFQFTRSTCCQTNRLWRALNTLFMFYLKSVVQLLNTVPSTESF